MRKILLFLSVILFQYFAHAQFTENFKDGDFTANPAWTGDAALYKVNQDFQLQLNSTADGIAVLAASNSMLQDMEWNIWVKLSFAPSDNNLARIYLSSDQADLKGALNGYYLKLGETGANDAIELVKQSGNAHTVVCRGSNGFLAAAFSVRIKVTRTAGSDWKIYADPLAGTHYQLQATGIDDTNTGGEFLGVYSKYTSSNSTKFYFDDFYAGPLIVDTIAPEPISVSMESNTTLSVVFNEAVETATATNVTNYLITPGSLIPQSALPDIADPKIIHLDFTQNFTPDVPYSVFISNVKDLAGNMMILAQLSFSWHQVKTFDVLINEIMADPSPPVNLPDAEYIELFNRSAYPVDLKNWVLAMGSSEKTFPQFIIPAGGYVILCDDGAKPLLESFGSVIDFSSFSVTNTGGTITLNDNNGQFIHTVSYTDDWYRTNYKKDGGWSLELIDPLNPCGDAANWSASRNESGGTPGKLNSVNGLNPDLIPPLISRVGVIDAKHVTVWFTESCSNTAILDVKNYSVDYGIGNPIAVTAWNPDNKVVDLTLPSPISAGTTYTLTSTGSISDCAGNKLVTGTSARFAIPSEPMPDDIVINELLFDPVEGCVDFVEVCNRSSKVLELKNLILANYDILSQAITSYHEISTHPYLVFPGDYFLLSTDSTLVKRIYKTTNPLAFINMASFPVMNNEDGVVAISTKGGTVLDFIAYTAAMQYPLLTNVDGVSLERINPDRPSEDPTNWHSASESSGYGTPGYKNSQFGNSSTDENEITLSPDIFSPDNDGYNDNLTIAYSFGTPGYNATITIYDAIGRNVRNLVSQELCGTSGAYSWDGITNDSHKASIGRYIVFVEIFDLDGNVKQYKKTTVLGGKL
jgi:hypothetical protein